MKLGKSGICYEPAAVMVWIVVLCSKLFAYTASTVERLLFPLIHPSFLSPVGLVLIITLVTEQPGTAPSLGQRPPIAP